MTKGEVKLKLEEGIDEVTNSGADAMCLVNSVAWEGLMDAISRADGELSNFQLVLPVARAVFEVREQECGMSEDVVVTVFQLMSEEGKAPLAL